MWWPFRSSLLVALVVAIGACDGGSLCFNCPTPPAITPVGVASVEVSPTVDTVEVSRARVFQLIIKDTLGRLVPPSLTSPLPQFELSTADTTTAKVISLMNGLAPAPFVVAGLRTGTSTIRAGAEGKRGTATLVVRGGPSAFVAVSAGSGSSCGLSPTGRAYCWGALPGSSAYSYVPVSASDALTFTTVSLGGPIPCALTMAGAAYCWGSFGQPVASKPTLVPGSMALTTIATGTNHACGLGANGHAYCWGYNLSGQVGSKNCGLGQSCPTPAAVDGGLIFSSVTAGGEHTCGLALGGTAYCWGENAYGQLGTGTAGANVPTPVAVAGGLTFAVLSAGATHSCGVTTAGVPYCWGRNDDGELGTADLRNRAAPAPVAGQIAVALVSAGVDFTCAATTSGVAYCWGRNDSGQLGDGSQVNRSQPVAVSGGLTFSSLSVGAGHACGIASQGGAYCWGYNIDCEVGSANLVNNITSPVRVFGQP